MNFPTVIDQKAIFHQTPEGIQENANAVYGRVRLRQPPMSVGVGVEIGQ